MISRVAAGIFFVFFLVGDVGCDAAGLFMYAFLPENGIEQVETAARPYAFIKFDKVIQKKRKEYMDPQSRNNMARLNDDLADIHSIMKRNIEEVLNRGEKLDRE